jgi:hypothetical protein
MSQVIQTNLTITMGMSVRELYEPGKKRVINYMSSDAIYMSALEVHEICQLVSISFTHVKGYHHFAYLFRKVLSLSNPWQEEF